MDDARSADEFRRIKLHADIEKDRLMDDRDPGGWEYMDQHLKQMREFLVNDRETSVAQAQREADEARRQGKERWSELWQDRAEKLKAYRFHWEQEESAA